jgi:small nuclear ribonucleoprotein G
VFTLFVIYYQDGEIRLCTNHITVAYVHLDSIIMEDKRLKLSLKGGSGNSQRRVIGTLRGYDAFLNVVLEETENCETGQYLGQIVIRGNSIIQFEGIDRVDIAATAALAATTTASNTDE